MSKTKKQDESLDDVINEIKGEFGNDSIMTLEDKPASDVEAIPTGSLSLDWALGIGGYPRGRIVEIFSHPGIGKTTLALLALAQAQKMGLPVAFIDAEQAMDREYAKKLGVDGKKLFISQPQNGEEGLSILAKLVKSKKFGVIVVDSVAALTPRAEIEGEMGEAHVGRLARLMGTAMRKMVVSIREANCVVIFINQVRMTIGNPYGPSEFQPGGMALKFYASVRLELRKADQIKDGDRVIGSQVKVKVIKNKVAPPFLQAEFDLMFGKGISRGSELLSMGEKTGVLHKEGNAFFFGEIKVGRGWDDAINTLETNLEMSTDIEKFIKEKLSTVTGDGQGV